MKQTALITGASEGIGKAFALLLARDGYDLALVARREDRLLQIKQALEPRYGIRIKVMACDLSRGDAVTTLFETLQREGIGVDMLINNAGIGVYGPFVASDLNKELQMISVNVIALTQLTKLFGQEMAKRGRGKILNVSSTAAFQPGPLMAVYYATKAYVQSFSEALSNELKGTGVTVTALCPGPTASGFQQAASMEHSRLVRGRQLPTSEEVAAFGYRALLSGKSFAIHGALNRVLAFGNRLLPRNWVTKFVRMIQEDRSSSETVE